MTGFQPGDRVVSIAATIRDDQQHDRAGRYGIIAADCRAWGPVTWDDGTTYIAWYGDLRPALTMAWPEPFLHTSGPTGNITLTVCPLCGAAVADRALHTFNHERTTTA